jgi:hypothetical protein
LAIDRPARPRQQRDQPVDFRACGLLGHWRRGQTPFL